MKKKFLFRTQFDFEDEIFSLAVYVEENLISCRYICIINDVYDEAQVLVKKNGEWIDEEYDEPTNFSDILGEIIDKNYNTSAATY